MLLSHTLFSLPQWNYTNWRPLSDSRDFFSDNIFIIHFQVLNQSSLPGDLENKGFPFTAGMYVMQTSLYKSSF